MNRTTEQNLKNGYRLIPTKPNNKKHTVSGYTHKHQCTLADFGGGRGAKLVAGVQFNGLFIIPIDDDLGGEAIRRIEHIEPEIYARLPIFDSTTGRGKHTLFVSPIAIEPGTGWCEQIEVKADHGQGITAPDIDLSTLPVLTAEEVQRVLDCIGYKPRQRPRAPTRATPAPISGHTDKDAIAAYNAGVDLCAVLENAGAIPAGRMTYRCNCGNHAHSPEETSSLSVIPARHSRNGEYVVKAHASACALYGTHHAFDVFRLLNGLTVKEALAELNPLKLSFDNPRQQSRQRPHATTPAAIVATPAPALDNSPDALRKRRERAIQRDIVVAELKARIENDKRLKPRAVDLGLALLQCGKLQCYATNKELSEITGYGESTLKLAFKELKLAGYGDRRGGWNVGTKCIRPTWSWTSYRGQSVYSSVAKLAPLDLYVHVDKNSQNESHIISPEQTSEEKKVNQSGVLESSTTLAELISAALELAHNTKRKASFKFVRDFVQQYAEKTYIDDGIKYHYTKQIAQNQYARQRARLEEKAKNMSLSTLKAAAKGAAGASNWHRKRGEEGKAKAKAYYSGLCEQEIDRREPTPVPVPMTFSSSLVLLQDMPELAPAGTGEQPVPAAVRSVIRTTPPPVRNINEKLQCGRWSLSFASQGGD